MSPPETHFSHCSAAETTKLWLETRDRGSDRQRTLTWVRDRNSGGKKINSTVNILMFLPITTPTFEKAGTE